MSDRIIAERIKVHSTTISHWRDDPRFEEWVGTAFDQFLAGGLKRVLVRALALAAKGSVKHMEFFAKYSGQATMSAGNASGDDEGSAKNYTIISLIPRPPDEPTETGRLEPNRLEE